MPYRSVPDDVLQRWLENAETQLGFWRDSVVEHTEGVTRATGQVVYWTGTVRDIREAMAQRLQETISEQDLHPGK